MRVEKYCGNYLMKGGNRLRMQKQKITFIALSLVLYLFTLKAGAQNQPNLYAKGGQAPATNFTGTVWVNMLVTPQDQLDCGAGLVTFEPGARTNWHMHPGGQVLLITKGKGLYQEKGSPVRVIKKGEVIKCLPGIEHWHGASPKKKLTHIAIAPDAEKGLAVWLRKVTDEEYNSKIKP